MKRIFVLLFLTVGILSCKQGKEFLVDIGLKKNYSQSDENKRSYNKEFLVFLRELDLALEKEQKVSTILRFLAKDFYYQGYAKDSKKFKLNYDGTEECSKILENIFDREIDVRTILYIIREVKKAFEENIDTTAFELPAKHFYFEKIFFSSSYDDIKFIKTVDPLSDEREIIIKIDYNRKLGKWEIFYLDFSFPSGD